MYGSHGARFWEKGRFIHGNESYQEAIDFFLEHFVIQIAGHSTAWVCLELNNLSLSGKQKLDFRVTRSTGNEGPKSQRKGATAVSP